MENNLDLFICTHRDFDKVVSSDVYKVIDSRKIGKVHLPLDDLFYSELYQFKYVFDNYQLKDYVGFCHYRRYFKFLDKVDVDSLFKDFDVITATPILFKGTVKEHYNYYHNVDDFNLIGDIIKDKFKDYYETYLKFSDSNLFLPYNMFIMKSKDFKEYCTFVFGVLSEYTKIVGTDIRKRIKDNKDKYLKSFSPNDTVDYQYRIGGYLAERLTNIFILNNFNLDKIGSIGIIRTEKKYCNEGNI